MYRPNFCAECGARIVRVRWRLWTSRRFCSSCEGRFRGARLVAPLVASVALLLSAFAAGRLTRPAPPPLLINRVTTPASSASNSLSRQETTQAPGNPAKGGAKPDASTPRYGADGTPDERPTDPDEIVSICGARTKKGTPCSRRVRGTGRCWQHRGRPAMLPPAKLIVEG
ncbi:MAG TPA: hypothetical protein VGB73_17070 [Pyrinomonadaceae bacterium]|jgi:hypothetical protein